MSACRNCGVTLVAPPAPNFCPVCGQATALTPPPLADLLRDTVQRQARTLIALVAAPGRLTREFLAGRRLRYVAPLRLYLNASLLFFLIVKVLGLSNSIQLEFAAVDRHGRTIRASENAAEFAATVDEMRRCVEQAGSCGWLRTQGARFGLKRMTLATRTELVTQRFVEMAPYAVFVLLPAFALLLTLAYRRRRRPYREHFVFSLHMHSFWFLALLLLAALPGETGWAVLPLAAVYALLAMHRVYAGRWWATLLRATTIGAFYVVALFITMTGLGIASVLVN